MSDLYKFITGANSITMYEEHDDGFRQEFLKLNQTLELDPETGNITLTTRDSSYIEIETFYRTLDTTDDATLYVRGEDRHTDLQGNPIPEPEDELDDDGIDDDQDGDGSNDDDLDGTSGNDDRNGGGGDDNVYGYDGDDSLHGDEGDDCLTGGSGDDSLDGDDGYDVLRGGDGADDLGGGAHDDILNGGIGDDSLSGGLGDDLISGGDGRDSGNGGGGRDNMDGGRGDDAIGGGAGSDSLSGSGGHDRLNGGAGNDRIDGGSGADGVRGGSGRDALTGGDDGDRFIFDDGDFSSAVGSTADHITDFEQGEGDLIVLSAVDANSTLDGDQAFVFIGSNAFSGTAGELRFQQADDFSYIYGDQNGDAAADFAIRLDDSVTVTVTDFIL